MTAFNYQGQKGTCLWCGQALRFSCSYLPTKSSNVRAAVIEWAKAHPKEPDLQGEPTYHGRYRVPEIGVVELHTGHNKPEEEWVVETEAYVTAGFWGSPRAREQGPPGHVEGDGHFHCGECARAFGHRMAQLGKRLVRQEET